MKIKIFSQLNPFLALIGFLFYPFIVFLLFGWFLIPFKIGYIKEIVGFGFFTLLFYCLFFLINSQKIKKWFLISSSFLLSSVVFIKVSFYSLFGVKITSSAVFVALETNKSEATEFFDMYFNATILSVCVVLFIPFVFCIKLIISDKLKFVKLLNYKGIWIKLSAILLICFSLYIIHWKFQKENFLFTFYSSYQEYNETKELLKNNLAKEQGDVFTNVQSSEKPQTYIVIIGESTSKKHLQLYGYNRDTNPLLSEIKNDLIIYKDVITPNVHTITALEKILTLSNVNNVKLTDNGSVVQLANQAGFETYWLSNQKPVGYYESIPTLIGSAAKNKYFIATDNYNYDIYDENLLPFLENILNEKPIKKVIFIHLIGTHGNYNKRYPNEYEVFKDEKKDLLFKHKKAYKAVNEYDNANLYNDFVVRSIIEKVRSKNQNSYVLYFSDHGDEVFDAIDFQGHSGYFGTKSMFEVPFVIWFSKKYKTQNFNYINLNFQPDLKYNLEDFIYTFSEISNIKFDGLDLSKSVLNNNFIERPRIIKNNRDYDKD